ncbi:hypothetical protein GXY_14467 [Novacetimonas hansenii ATCC 23769]|uniref:Uncharacterized protein n=1 Tax=Novacetimonas hansenii ATCC 23769 TaxID=714995 RepID=D5QIB2_NOVHA|nr:hypothetical protein GXY_14467 [Novacetimonas hansenii ATCC 23769]
MQPGWGYAGPVEGVVRKMSPPRRGGASSPVSTSAFTPPPALADVSPDAGVGVLAGALADAATGALTGGCLAGTLVADAAGVGLRGTGGGSGAEDVAAASGAASSPVSTSAFTPPPALADVSPDAGVGVLAGALADAATGALTGCLAGALAADAVGVRMLRVAGAGAKAPAATDVEVGAAGVADGMERISSDAGSGRAGRIASAAGSGTPDCGRDVIGAEGAGAADTAGGGATTGAEGAERIASDAGSGA